MKENKALNEAKQTVERQVLATSAFSASFFGEIYASGTNPRRLKG